MGPKDRVMSSIRRSKACLNPSKYSFGVCRSRITKSRLASLRSAVRMEYKDRPPVPEAALECAMLFTLIARSRRCLRSDM